MASFQIARAGFSPALSLRSCLPRRRLTSPRTLHINSRVQESNNDSSGEEQPESLFMKELKRRGMTPTSLLEEKNRGSLGLGEKEMEGKEETGGGKRNSVVSTEFDTGLTNQRERSLALNSEGLEGLIPRGKLLLTLGGTFFLAFWPLILITIAFFAALYFYFGPSFVHDASKMPASPPPYVDPYALLEDERISHVAPNLK